MADTLPDLDALERLAKAAILIEWSVSGKGTIRAGDDIWIATINWRNREANAAFIAAAHPQAVLALVAEIRRVRRASYTQGDTVIVQEAPDDR